MIRSKKHSILFFVILLQTYALVSSVLADPTHVVVNVQQKHQIIDGFGASDCWSFQKIGAWGDDKKNQVADLLFSVDEGIGLSQWRFNIGGGINTTSISNDWRTVETFETGPGEYDWTRQAEERWFLDAAKDRGVDQFIAFVNSPPGRMTRNGLTNCSDGGGSTNLKNGWENQYARYLKDILVHFKDDWDIEFDHISPVNEPQWEWNNGSNQEGNRASNDDVRRITLALYDSLENAGLNTEISLVESGDLRSWYQYNSGMENEYGESYGSYLDELISHADLEGKIGKHIGGHSYWSDLINTKLVQDRQILLSHLDDFQDAGWRYWVTEYTILEGANGAGGRGRDLGMETALDVARVMYHDLTILNASSWQWWTAVSPENFKDGLLYTDYKDNPQTQNIIESKLLWAFGNYSRFIRPGYRRIELSGAENKFGLMGSAYVSENEGALAIVFVNASSGSKDISLQIEGFEWQSEGVAYLTSDTPGDDLKKLENIPLDQDIMIPGKSVLTLLISEESSKPPFEGFDPTQYQLFQNYPNPFNSETNLCFNLPQPGSAELSIYSLNGENVHRVSWANMSGGIQQYSWDGTTGDQKSSSSGIYLYTLRAGNHIKSKKMLFIQ